MPADIQKINSICFNKCFMCLLADQVSKYGTIGFVIRGSRVCKKTRA